MFINITLFPARYGYYVNRVAIVSGTALLSTVLSDAPRKVKKLSVKQLGSMVKFTRTSLTGMVTFKTLHIYMYFSL